ncbi:MAG: hypothetical protein H0T65_02650 [Deltaproteobacteria bacterium]|nr:hypothetical protein [Deltaproteobacteria bacterium]
MQRHAGRRVVGGQVSFRFKADRLFVIGNEVLPDVQVDLARPRIAKASVFGRASDALRMTFGLPHASVTQPGDEVIYPLKNGKGYRLAVPMTIDGGADGKWRAYIDPSSGEIIDTESLLHYTTGTVLFRSVDRHPLRGRVDKPAPRLRVKVDGVDQTTGADGTVTWSSMVAATVVTSVVGDRVEIVNKGAAAPMTVSTMLSVPPAGQAVWDASANTEDDAQLVTYVAVNTVKDYIRNFIDPQLPLLEQQLKANVNIQKSCNAFFDGETINFFTASMSCQNTGLLEDVVYHEFGHAFHSAEIIDGVGRYDGAMGEGVADFLAASVTGDPGMGRGFFYSDEPLRQLDPPGDEFRWPEDIVEIHGTGRIIGGALWDLRKAMITKLGETPGIAITNKLFLGAVRRSIDIPSAFVEVLAADDNDGNIENGTPNECTIRDAFGRHGLRFVTGTVDAPDKLVSTAPTQQIRFKLTGLSTRCTSDAIARVLLIWVPGSATKAPAAGTVEMTQESPGVYVGTLPLPKDDLIHYSARVIFDDGSTLVLADNLADRYYQLYNGETTPLYCTSFDEDPFANGWRTGTSKPGTPSPWKVENGVLVQVGNYPKELTTYAEMPSVNIGRWSDVHLQYRRKLAVEDSQFDKARITVNGAQAYTNASANRGDSSAAHHIDRETRFHDVRITGLTTGHNLRVAFELAADAGLEFDGWNIDDLCIVANVNSVCGDGKVSPTETCDEGERNGNHPNTCRTWCAAPRCGDRIVDDKEECDHGPGGSSECTSMCKSLVDEAGCCSAQGGGAAGSASLALLVLMMTRRRRGRRGCAR